MYIIYMDIYIYIIIYTQTDLSVCVYIIYIYMCVCVRAMVKTLLILSWHGMVIPPLVNLYPKDSQDGMDTPYTMFWPWPVCI